MADQGAFITQQGQVDVDDLAALLRKHDTKDEFGIGRQMATSQSTLLLQKKKQMDEVQQQLDAAKEDYERRMRICDERQQQLKLQRTQIQDRVHNFEKYVLENDAKRLRAQRKAQEEVRLQDLKSQEIISFAEQLEGLKLGKARKLNSLDLEARYRQYLESVVEISEFNEILEIVSRNETLTTTNKSLRKRVEDHLADTEKAKEELSSYTKSRQNDILFNNNLIATLLKKLETTKEKNDFLEQQHYSRGTHAMERVRELGEIRMSIYNIYQRCRIKHPLEHPDEHTRLLNILDAVGQRVQDLESICYDFQHANESPKEKTKGK